MFAALEMAFNRDLSHRILFIVLTDGEADNDQKPLIKRLIELRLTHHDLAGDRLNVLFVRIGDDFKARMFLRDLDDCREIGQSVDTKTDNLIYEMGPRNMILNAIHEHLDDRFKEPILDRWNSFINSSDPSIETKIRMAAYVFLVFIVFALIMIAIAFNNYLYGH